MKGAGLIMGRTEQFFFLNMQFSQTNKWKLYMSSPNHKYEKQPRTRVPRSWMAISTTCQLYKRLRQSTPFCPEFPKQHEKNLTEPPEKKKRHSGRKKLKWFKCPKTQTEYTELIDNTWAAERTHVSVTVWGNVTHFKRSTRSSDEVVTALCDPSGPKLFCPRHSLNRYIAIDLYFRTFFNLHTQKARVGGGNVKKKTAQSVSGGGEDGG